MRQIKNLAFSKGDSFNARVLGKTTKTRFLFVLFTNTERAPCYFRCNVGPWGQKVNKVLTRGFYDVLEGVTDNKN